MKVSFRRKAENIHENLVISGMCVILLFMNNVLRIADSLCNDFTDSRFSKPSPGNFTDGNKFLYVM